MSLRTYFDSALKKDAQTSADERRRALGVTVKKGDEAARHLKQAQTSLEKIRAKQAGRRRQHA
jgi:GTP cyclohydrolase III